MYEILKPQEIEKRSFEIIEKELSVKLPDDIGPVVKRVIHASADFDYAENLLFSENVIQTALCALRSGADILTDTNMCKAGINKTILGKYGGTVKCFMADPDVAEVAEKKGITRAAASMMKARDTGEQYIYAVGNAPTALLELNEQIINKEICPHLIIAVPVGFVNVVSSKELIMDSEVPYIVSKGRKGGSTIAAAICNALLYML